MGRSRRVTVAWPGIAGVDADLSEREDIRGREQQVVEDFLRRPILELGQAMDRFGRPLSIPRDEEAVSSRSAIAGRPPLPDGSP
jgi:hypothetical protein